jgi:hypothetical protein
MKNQKGSAIIMVLVILTVLVITSTYLMQNKTQRAGFTRHMSNEKKLEVLMEAVLDMTKANIKKYANNHKPDAPASAINVNKLLRSPGTTSNGLHANNGKNAIMSVTNETTSITEEFYKLAVDSITNGDPNFKILSVDVQIVHAEAFGEPSDGYKVVGVNEKTTKPTAKGKNIFPNLHAKPNKWRMPLQYPPHNEDGDYTDIWNLPGLPPKAHNGFPYQSPKIKVNLNYKDLPDIVLNVMDIEDSVNINLLLKHAVSDIGSESAFEFGIHLDDDFVNHVNGILNFIGQDEISDESITENISKYMGDTATMDIENLILKEVDTFKNFGDSLTTQELQNKVMKDNSTPYTPGSPKPDPNSELIEKGGLLQLTCKATYAPPGASKTIERTLIAEVPFKLSDVQPIAPEHTFFVANSKLLGAPGSGSVEGNIDFNRSDDGAASLGIDYEFYLHNMHHAGRKNEPAYSLSYQVASGKDPKAGKIRVNGDDIDPVPLFMGTLDGIETSELGALALTDSNDHKERDLQFKITFAWFKVMQNISQLTDSVKLHLPVLLTTDDAEDFKPAVKSGIDGIYQMYSEKNFDDIFTMPTLFYGYGHMDYPLGNKIEGMVPAKVSEAYVVAQVHNQLTFDVTVFKSDKVKPSTTPWHKPIKTYYGYKNISKYPHTNKPIPYGLPNIKTFDTIEENFTGKDYSDMPANCYSDIQYRKKASRFYPDIESLKNDCIFSVDEGGLKNPDDTIDISGVIYIDVDNFNFNSFPDDAIFKGNGLIVSNNITIAKDINLADDDESTLGIIARTGSLIIKSENEEEVKVSASCFSNGPPNITKAIIFGNLIVNAFDRQDVYNTHVRYSPDNISIKGNSFNDKTNDRRYYASFADNWSKSYFQKK